MIYLQALVVLSALGGILTVLLLVADRFLANYGPCEIVINEGSPFVVDGGCKLLEALYEQRIFIPSACGGQGTCGFCKVQVLAGGGPVLPTELPYLSVAEVDGGTRLACQVKVREDVVVRIREEFLHVQEFRAVVTSTRLLTSDTREIQLKLMEPEDIEFRPGQYVQVFVPGTGETTFRAYSIASPPSRRHEVELLVRLIPGGLGSTYLHSVQVDDEVTFTGPYGEFVLDDDASSELICVGGGCGMAPMRSILRHIHEVAPEQRCWLFFGARTALDAMYHSDFLALQAAMPNLRIHYALSEPEQSPDWEGETGFIHESVARHLCTEGARQAFLCGPPPMIEATMTVLSERGIDRERVFYDEF